METQTNSSFRIVMVEDNPADIVLVREALNVHAVRCNLETYDTGEGALMALAKWVGETSGPPDLVLLDWNLPILGGADVLRAIREKPALHSVPVAILTSSGSPRDRAQALNLGATRYIQKPMGLDEFVQQVGDHICQMLTADQT